MKFKLSALAVLFAMSVVQASTSRPMDHAPLGVMGDHMHDQGEFMVSYRYMHMGMDGNRSGTSRQGISDVANDFAIIPTKMNMDMHMLGAMYGLSDSVTIMVMMPYVRNQMSHYRRMQKDTFEADFGSNLGDISVSSMVNLYEDAISHVHLNAGISLPFGSIAERDDTPMGTSVKLPYPMQTGSGTYDLLPGITYVMSLDSISIGAQGSAVVRLGDNAANYRLGNKLKLTSWFQKDINRWWGTSVRLAYEHTGNIHGRDTDFDMLRNMVATARPDLRRGERLDIAFGINVLGHDRVDNHRLALEVGIPVYQQLTGPQLETDWWVTLGWQKVLFD